MDGAYFRRRRQMAVYQNDRSRLVFAVACELVRAGLDDQLIARILMTTECGVTRARGANSLPIASYMRAPCAVLMIFQLTLDLEMMNGKHAVLPDRRQDTRCYMGQRSGFFRAGKLHAVRAQSFPDFRNLHSNKRKVLEIKGDDGNATKKAIPLGAWWLGHPRRRQYDGGQRFMPQCGTGRGGWETY